MPNAFAYLVLFAWPFIAHKICKRVSVTDAAILLLLVPYLFLPKNTGVDLPLLPMVDKSSIAAIVALILLRKHLRETSNIKFTLTTKACWVALFGGYLCTTFLNGDPLVFGQRVIPGMRFWDYLGGAFDRYFSFFVPFYIGYKLLGTVNAHQRFVYWFALSGLVYLIPMFWEIRMSPQLHAQFYGFFPHDDFGQQIRDGGFRPVVFLGHGLLVAFYAFSACICALAWKRENAKLWRLRSIYAFAVLLVGVIACKTLSVVFYLLLGFALILLVPATKKYLVMCVLAFGLLFYPALRILASPSLEWFSQKIEEVKPERGLSFRFRLDNEEQLLEKAQERAWFGWGNWGRNMVFSDAGERLSTTDGIWIIRFGVGGWVAYLSFMGVLTLPFWLSLRARKRVALDGGTDIYTQALLVILICNMIDFIPNSSLSALTFLLAGALAGAAARGLAKPVSKEPVLK